MEVHFAEIRPLLQMGVLGLLLLYALWRGAGPERLCALLLMNMLFADALYHALIPLGLHALRVDVGHLIIDAFTAIALALVALRANRIYPIGIAGLQLVSLVAHVAQALNPMVTPLAYRILIVAPSYLVIVVFAIGILAHRIRVKKYKIYPAWRPSYSPLQEIVQKQ